jgi:hypothetical protein
MTNMPITHIKDFINKNLFDSKGRLCSPKCTLKYLINVDPEIYKYFLNKLEQGQSVPESIYLLLNNLDCAPKCEFCENKVDFKYFKTGFSKTCKKPECLKKGYGKNPHIPTQQERINLSKRMTENNPMFNKEISNRVRKTQKINGGGKLPIHSQESISKSLESRYDKYDTFSPRSKLFKSKEYQLPSKKIVKIQGYENKGLDFLLKTKEEDDIVICGRKHFFRYIFEGKNKIYYPDIYIPSENLYIDVKSDYTYSNDLNKNLTKKETILSKGFNFQFWIFDAKGKLTIK